MKKRFAALAVTCACLAPVVAQATAVELTWSRQWTTSHEAKTGSASTTAEIIARDESNNRLWVVGTEGIDILDAATGNRVETIDLSGIGDANSIAIKDGRVAVALSAEVKTDPGKVLFFDLNSNKLAEVTVGANPDMVVFTQDSRLLVANEGEGYDDAHDAVGSISIIESGYTVSTAGFEAYNGQEDALRSQGVRIFPDRSAADDLEPEYIAVSPDGKTAYVTLQENNSLAVVDLTSNTVSEILALGTKDHSVAGNGIDASNKDDLKGNVQNWPVQGVYMPDAIAAYQVNGKEYYVTANEGDSRSETKSVGEVKLDPTAFPDAANLQKKENLGKLEISAIDGDTDGDGDYDQLFSYGSRSFSIWDAQGKLVWDSGDFIETYLRENYPDLLDDGRSDNKGPEPEGVALLKADGATLAFIGLERSNAILAFNITDPTNPDFLSLIFHEGDTAPEGLLAYGHDGDYWLAVANEGSKTSTLYQLDVQPVPEPASIALFSCGLLGLAIAGRRRK